MRYSFTKDYLTAGGLAAGVHYKMQRESVIREHVHFFRLTDFHANEYAPITHNKNIGEAFAEQNIYIIIILMPQKLLYTKSET